MAQTATSSPSVVLPTVREFERRVRERFGDDLRETRLFGSFAKGTAGEDSDVDVFVLLRTASYRDRCTVLDLATDLFLETGHLVSPTIFDDATHATHLRQERPLMMEIERDGIAP